MLAVVWLSLQTPPDAAERPTDELKSDDIHTEDGMAGDEDSSARNQRMNSVKRIAAHDHAKVHVGDVNSTNMCNYAAPTGDRCLADLRLAEPHEGSHRADERGSSQRLIPVGCS
jgi:hypothetical protein